MIQRKKDRDREQKEGERLSKKGMREKKERDKEAEQEKGGEREKQAEFGLPDRAVWSSPSETLHRHCETSRQSQRVRADMTV